MSEHPAPHSSRRLAAAKVAAVVLLAGVLATASAVLLGGWVLGEDILVRMRPGYAAMAPSTAACLMLASAAFLVRRSGRWGRRFTPFAAFAVALIALVDLAVIFAGAATGVDALVWPGDPRFERAAMAPATAICSLLAATCLFRRWRAPLEDDGPPPGTTATTGLLLTLVALVGYAFDASALYAVSIFTAMALHTALCFAALFLAALLRRPDVGWVGVVLNPGAGSAGARRVLPIVILVPLVLCLAGLAATDRGLFSANFRLSLMAITMMGLLAAAVLRNAALENRTERRLLDTAGRLESTLADRNLLLREMNHRVKNNLQQINALLRLEFRKLSDPACQAAFRATSERIQALGVVHTLLVGSARPSQVRAPAFLAAIAKSVSDSRGAEGRGVTITAQAADTGLDLDFALTLGLLVNELLVGALTERDGEGRILVLLRETPGEGYVLTLRDERPAPEAASADPRHASPGEQIVRGLTAQLGGSLSVTSGEAEGVTFFAVFPAPQTDRAKT